MCLNFTSFADGWKTASIWKAPEQDCFLQKPEELDRKELHCLNCEERVLCEEVIPEYRDRVGLQWDTSALYVFKRNKQIGIYFVTITII